MKKFSSLVLAVLILLSLASCGSEVGKNARPREAAKQSLKSEPSAKEEKTDSIILINAEIDGKTELKSRPGTELTAHAVIPEGMAVDCWTLNGEPQPERGSSFRFTPEGSTAAEAVLREEYRVSAVNARMQLLDEDGRPGGETFTEFIFEKDYENPVTAQTLPGGSVSLYVQAAVPSGYEIDCWLINGVPYYFDSSVNGFAVHELNESRVYEAVLKEAYVPQKYRQPAAETEAIPEPEPETVYYSVSCSGCAFSGGGAGGSSGRVPAGTVISVWSTAGDCVWWSGSYSTDWNQPGPTSFSYTVNSDCSFTASCVIN